VLCFRVLVKLNPSLFTRSVEGHIPGFAVSIKIDLSPLESALAKNGGGASQGKPAVPSPVSSQKESAGELDSIHRRGRGLVEFYELGHEPRVMHPGIQ
jgi:hypothetical protein